MSRSTHAAPTPADHEGLRREAFQHKLEQFNPGMVWLDTEHRIVALNEVAIQILGPSVQGTLGIDPASLIGSDVLKVHPPKSREKIEFLLRMTTRPEDASPSPPPIAMMINIPDRMLMLKVSKMNDAAGHAGTCMIFYDLTDLTIALPTVAEVDGQPALRLLSRIPVYRRNRIVLVNVDEVGRFEGDGHYTKIVTSDDCYLCNLSMAVLENRLDPQKFLRVHRSHIINLDYAAELARVDDGMLVAMKEGIGGPVPVSKSKLQTLKDCFGLA